MTNCDTSQRTANSGASKRFLRVEKVSNSLQMVMKGKDSWGLQSLTIHNQRLYKSKIIEDCKNQRFRTNIDKVSVDWKCSSSIWFGVCNLYA